MYISCSRLKTELPWFEKLHKMMMDHVSAEPVALGTSTGYDKDGQVDIDEDNCSETPPPHMPTSSLLLLMDTIEHSQSDPFTKRIARSEPAAGIILPAQTQSSITPLQTAASPSASSSSTSNKRK